MLRTNYRCVQSLNISVDVAKCVENVHTLIHYTHFWTVTKMTCLHWTIYLWKGFYSIRCPLMLRTNYRWVQSLNISVDFAKINVWKMFTNSTSSLTFCPLRKTTSPNWTIYSWQGFNSLVCPLMLKTNYRCVQSLNISVDVTKCVKMFTNSPSSLTFCPLLKTTCPNWTIYSRQGFNSLVCPLMLKTNYGCVQSLNISVDVAKCVENVHTLIHYTHFWTVTWKDLSSLNNLFMAIFQLIRMSSYAKNKLRKCSITQHQCRRRQMCGKCSQIHPVHSLFVLYKKRLLLVEQSIHGKVST